MNSGCFLGRRTIPAAASGRFFRKLRIGVLSPVRIGCATAGTSCFQKREPECLQAIYGQRT